MLRLIFILTNELLTQILFYLKICNLLFAIMKSTSFTLCAIGVIVLSTCFQVSSLINASTANGAKEEKKTFTANQLLEGDLESQDQLQRNTSSSSSPENVTCAGHSMDDFPDDIFTQEQRRHGAVLLHAFCGFYCFLLTAYVCNDYLLPALDIICTDLKISPNVAGATFLATASCFPELFVNVIGTFLTESDLGVGTVVGGAVFNTFATPAFGALSAVQGIKLDWWILSRDCIIYVISVSVLVLVMWDGLITWWEATILMVLFTAYFTFLFLHDSLLRWGNKIKTKFRKSSKLTPDTAQSNSEHDNMPNGLYKPFVHCELVAEYRNSMKKARKLKIIENGNHPSVIEEISPVEEYQEPEFPFANGPSGTFWNKVWFILTWPIKILMFVTIPDSRYKKLRNWYPLTFIMCVIWIAISSYLVSWTMTVIGDTLGIADSIMGITFLAAGGNMPELVSIVILSRHGNGDMAMSNTLGANTLDVLLCLGLPWMIRTLMTGKVVEIDSGALAYSVISIVICVVGFFCVTAYFKFTLNKKVGFACLVMYALFLTFAILMESNVFFPVNLPMCDL